MLTSQLRKPLISNNQSSKAITFPHPCADQRRQTKIKKLMKARKAGRGPDGERTTSDKPTKAQTRSGKQAIGD